MNTSFQDISLTDICSIVEDTLRQSAPAVEKMGDTLDAIGEQANIPAIEVGGEWMAKAARMTVQLLDMLNADGIRVIDKNGSRGIKDQLLAMQAYKEIKRRLTA